MAELNALKAQLKEQNQRLLAVTQDKARLEARNKVNQMKEEEGIGEKALPPPPPPPPPPNPNTSRVSRAAAV